MEYITYLVDWFEKKLSRLKLEYSNELEAFKGFEPKKENLYQDEIAFLRHCYRTCGNLNRDKALDFVNLVLKKRYKKNLPSKNTLNRCHSELSMNQTLPYSSIEIGSIMASIIDPYKHPIYFSHFSAVLNSIQYNENENGGYFFPYLVNFHLESVAISKVEKLSQTYLSGEHNWKVVERKDLYYFYVLTLNQCLKKLSYYEIYDLSLCLSFYGLEECKKLIKRYFIEGEL